MTSSSDTEKGIILDGDKSWSIGSNREQFHFATEIGWLVEDGEVTSVVKNSTYKGETVKFYNSLSAVGDASTWEVRYVDNCGKGQPNQIMQLGTRRAGLPLRQCEDRRIAVKERIFQTLRDLRAYALSKGVEVVFFYHEEDSYLMRFANSAVSLNTNEHLIRLEITAYDGRKRASYEMITDLGKLEEMKQGRGYRRRDGAARPASELPAHHPDLQRIFRR